MTRSTNLNRHSTYRPTDSPTKNNIIKYILQKIWRKSKPKADTIAFTEGGTEAMRINSDGNVALAKNIGLGGATPTTSGTGITFPASASASSNANTLDDYEEGTFTPSLARSITPPSVTLLSSSGNYIKIGRQVYVTGLIIVSAVATSGTGAVTITGLPFGGNGEHYQNVGSLGYNDVFTGDIDRCYMDRFGGSQLIIIAAGETQSDYSGTITTGYLSFSATYYT